MLRAARGKWISEQQAGEFIRDAREIAEPCDKHFFVTELF